MWKKPKFFQYQKVLNIFVKVSNEILFYLLFHWGMALVSLSGKNTD
jgi:hypothetical protein